MHKSSPGPAFVAHAIVPGMGLGVAFVLGAVVSSTDEVAFSAIADRLNVPRHLIGTIEGVRRKRSA